jgi:hypothetical protein
MKNEKKYECIIDKIRKLKVLSELGVRHEREVAKTKLNLFLKKYKIGLDELDDPDCKERSISFAKNSDFKIILYQIVWSVNSETEIYVHSGSKKITAWLTTSEFIEVLNKYKYFASIYRRQKNNFDLAFIHSYELYRNKTDVDETTEKDEGNDEDLKSIRKLMNAMPENGYISTSTQLESK